MKSRLPLSDIAKLEMSYTRVRLVLTSRQQVTGQAWYEFNVAIVVVTL
jgi:hypothetical protein